MRISYLYSDLDVSFFLRFWSIFYPFDPDPWIRIILRIRIQEAQNLADPADPDPDPKHYIIVICLNKTREG